MACGPCVSMCACQRVVVPGVQADFVTVVGGRTDHRRRLEADVRSGPERAAQQDVPAVQAGRPGAHHLDQEGGPQQPPDMAPHVVRARRKRRMEARRPCRRNRRHSTGTPSRVPVERVHIHPQAEHRAPVQRLSSCLTPCGVGMHRWWRFIIAIRLPQPLEERNPGSPPPTVPAESRGSIEAPARILDAGLAVLDVLVAGTRSRRGFPPCGCRPAAESGLRRG